MSISFSMPAALPRRNVSHNRHVCDVLRQHRMMAGQRTHKDRARDFLTQRALQQTMFCSRELRDETTARWLEDWLGHHGLDNLHHCDALQVSSDEYLLRTFKEPAVVLQIKKPIPGRTTRNNPYIKRRYFCYDVEIVPKQLALRILAARVQIAEELTVDIPSVADESERVRLLYRKRILSEEATGLNGDILNFPSDSDSRGSPFRKANMDLVKNYTLYLGLLSACNGLAPHGRDAEFLVDFVDTHSSQLLAPYGGDHGAADVVIEELLATPPAVRDGSLFDPGLLASVVLQRRAECAEEWLEVVRGVKEEHLMLERKFLEDTL